MHVGVLAVADAGDRVLAVPVWYAYAPGGTVDVITGGESRKARYLHTAGRFSLSAQTETAPYRYVSVEGPVVAEGRTGDRRRAATWRTGTSVRRSAISTWRRRRPTRLPVSCSACHRVVVTTDFAKQFGGD